MEKDIMVSREWESSEPQEGLTNVVEGAIKVQKKIFINVEEHITLLLISPVHKVFLLLIMFPLKLGY